MKETKVVEKREIRTVEITTDDIEALLEKHLKLSSDASFHWSAGQWPSLTVTDTIVTIEEGDV